MIIRYNYCTTEITGTCHIEMIAEYYKLLAKQCDSRLHGKITVKL